MNKELKNEIYDRLEDLFSMYYKRDKFQFEKPILRFSNSGFSIQLSQKSEYHDNINFQIPIIVMNNKISQIKELIEVSPIVFMKLQEKVEKLDDFAYQAFYMAWTLYGVEDCKRMYDDHVQFMEQVGHAFLNRYSSLEGIHQFLNLKYLNEFDPDGDIDHYRKIKSFFGEREILSGLIAAYLINFEDIERLIYQYKLLYKHKNMDEKLDKVVDYFKK